MATGWFLRAMDWYQKAQALAQAGNDDAVLRWDSCVRFMERNQVNVTGAERESSDAGFAERGTQALTIIDGITSWL